MPLILGQRFASEYLTLKDDVTGAQIIALTTSRHSNSKYYQTHPSWTPDSKHLLVARMGGGGIAVIDVENRRHVGSVFGMKPTPRHLLLLKQPCVQGHRANTGKCTT